MKTGLLSLLLLLLVGSPACSQAGINESEIPGENPLKGNVTEVSGRMIDIRPVVRGAEVYPHYNKFRFGVSIPEKYVGKQYAVGMREYPGPMRVRAGRKCKLIIALDNPDLKSEQWKPTGEKFNINSVRHYFYSCTYESPGQWIDVPTPTASINPVLLFAEGLRVADTPEPPGVVIARTQTLRNGMITNPSIVILPNGDYLAACSGAFREEGTPLGASFFRSSDRGQSWKVLSKNNGAVNFYNLFTHEGAVYMMGTASKTGHVVIRRSADNGKTWTSPDETSGKGVLLSDKRYHSAPVPVVIHNGRIWRAFETNAEGEGRKAFVMSAPVGSDLLEASNWSCTNPLESDPAWLAGKGLNFKQWIEGNVVVSPQGEVVNILRVDEEAYSATAAMIHVKNPQQATFDPSKDILEMPGAGKKFTIRYDPVSSRYWALTNAITEADHAKTTSRYPEGLPGGLIRNHLTLLSSADLRKWTVQDTIITSDNPFFDGFQYVDWQFDGKDIIAVIRLAMGEERGLPVRQHDANLFVFRRIPNFREGGIIPARLQTLNP